MIAGVRVVPIKKFEDKRGWLAEIYRHDEMDVLPTMGYISWTKPQIARGPHEHLYQSDVFAFVIGKFRLTLWDNRPESKTYKEKMVLDLGEEKPAYVLIPPKVVHVYRCLTESGGLVVNLPDRLYKGLSKKEPVDEIRHEEDPNSPFKPE